VRVVELEQGLKGAEVEQGVGVEFVYMMYTCLFQFQLWRI